MKDEFKFHSIVLAGNLRKSRSYEGWIQVPFYCTGRELEKVKELWRINSSSTLLYWQGTWESQGVMKDEFKFHSIVLAGNLRKSRSYEGWIQVPFYCIGRELEKVKELWRMNSSSILLYWQGTWESQGVMKDEFKFRSIVVAGNLRKSRSYEGWIQVPFYCIGRELEKVQELWSMNSSSIILYWQGTWESQGVMKDEFKFHSIVLAGNLRKSRSYEGWIQVPFFCVGRELEKVKELWRMNSRSILLYWQGTGESQGVMKDEFKFHSIVLAGNLRKSRSYEGWIQVPFYCIGRELEKVKELWRIFGARSQVPL